MSILIKNIRQLAGVRENSTLLRGKELSELPFINNAWIHIENNIIVGCGSMDSLNIKEFKNSIDATGRLVMPCWCDSHTHLVFAGSRENEFVDKIKGKTYAEIAAHGGGILNSANKLNDTTEDELFNQAWKRLEQIAKPEPVQ